MAGFGARSRDGTRGRSSRPRATARFTIPQLSTARTLCHGSSRSSSATAAQRRLVFVFVPSITLLGMSRVGGLLVNPGFGNRGQLFVGRLLLVERFLQQIGRLLVPHARAQATSVP